MEKSLRAIAKEIEFWYHQNHRKLPWRQNQDPYSIWISEVMLQQTTVSAVVPYFERFISQFPHVHALAEAPLEEVLQAWSGLGYYSRARMLHRSAQELAEKGFPRKAELLIQLPGFGPYTARAVASLAFGERVGVLDGNVIRVLTRLLGLRVSWWTTVERRKLQAIADEFVQEGNPSIINQALMELGASVCTHQKPNCFMCPWASSCVALRTQEIENLPLKKQRKNKEIWIWKPELRVKKKAVLLVKNNYLPFLKNQLIFPGSAQKTKKKPRSFAFRHNITHYDIYVQILEKMPLKIEKEGWSKQKWVQFKNLKAVNPSSLLQKVLSQQF